jgi:glycosyltransferase involved in cell wall biosynthesis
VTHPPLVCFSHLRWDDVTQRPHHLMMRAARGRPVHVIEEMRITDAAPSITWHQRDGVTIVDRSGPDDPATAPVLRRLVTDYVGSVGAKPWLWYYTPFALGWLDTVDPSAVVYDCMDDLTAFRGASPELAALEARLLDRSDVVFAGGRTLYETKRSLHGNVHLLPSSVDVAHFALARGSKTDPQDQASIPHPRIGWFGVIDERFDRPLLEAVAAAHPAWSFVLIGPVVKLRPDEVPSAPNIHLLGRKPYATLPAYLSGWDVAMMPFARNAATRAISPTKTPEYLAGGQPVVATSVPDVVEPYGRLGLVRIADSPVAFGAAIGAALLDDRAALRAAADRFLARHSWDATWAAMERAVDAAIATRGPGRALVGPSVPAIAG